jgi:hypothetical protein
MKRPLDRADAALLAAYLLVALLGTWQNALLVIDGAVYLAAAWLGDAWSLFFDQTTGRAVSTFLQFGPAWALSAVVGTSTRTFLIASHLFYFGIPLGLWAIVRRIEPQPVYARLYLAAALTLVCFTSEMVQGMGLWMIWLAWMAEPARPRRARVLATALLAPAIAFTHPGLALLSVGLAVLGAGLAWMGRPFPRRLAIAAGAMGAFLVAAYFVEAALWPPTNPTLVAQHAAAKYDYIDPVWILGTLAFFPMLAALWLLLVAPGLQAAGMRWRLPPPAIAVIGVAGLWFAMAGTNSLTWIFARQSAPYALALALALALASPPAAWAGLARLPLCLFAAIMAAAALSYTVDLALFGRAVDARLAALAGGPAPAPHLAHADLAQAAAAERSAARIYLKWAAAPDYVRDIVLPDYGANRMTFVFYTFFRSDRRAALYRVLDRPGEWKPFECRPLERLEPRVRDAIDRRFVEFLHHDYCVEGRP